jgi:dTDP-4-amino-4,6-dideoxygalactose transaminase
MGQMQQEENPFCGIFQGRIGQMISFNEPPLVGTEEQYISEAIANRKICGDGPFTRKCSAWLEEHMKTAKALLTTSCTHATEMAALLAGIGEGDEVIMPSYTFSSTANAFVLRGGVPVFVDIRPDTMNIDEEKIEDAVTERTKAIVVVHYAGVGCEMERICGIAGRHNLTVIEDAAQAVMAFYKGRALGTIGDFGCYSFHETKNYSMGEGGALLIRDEKDRERAEIIREKGTDRSRFFRGQVDKYTWVDAGSSYLPSELNAAHLFAQLEQAERINADRLRSWERYQQMLLPLEREGILSLPVVPKTCKHNAHMFYIKAKDLAERSRLLAFLKERGILAVFHYIPLHSAPAGRQFGRFHGEDVYTTKESERLLRLPLYYGLSEADQNRVVAAVKEFYGK